MTDETKQLDRETDNAHKAMLFDNAEKAIQSALETARSAHRVAMLKRGWERGEAHPSLALMEVCVRSLVQANDAARYARHSLLFINPLEEQP